MERKFKTKMTLEELKTKDLSRIPVKADRVYLACRDNHKYLGDYVYEFCIMTKNGQGVMFATEQDLHSFKIYPADKVLFLEPNAITCYMEPGTKTQTMNSAEITVDKFGALFRIDFQKLIDRGFNFKGLTRLNAACIKNQKAYSDRLLKEFEDHQKWLNTKAPIMGLDDF